MVNLLQKGRLPPLPGVKQLDKGVLSLQLSQPHAGCAHAGLQPLDTNLLSTAILKAVKEKKFQDNTGK